MKRHRLITICIMTFTFCFAFSKASSIESLVISNYTPTQNSIHNNTTEKEKRKTQKPNKPIIINDTIQKEIWNNIFEEYPQFIGGRKALIEFLETYIKYPIIAIENNIGGYSIVRFTVTDLGEIKNVRLERGFDPSADIEAMRGIKRMPNWMPAPKNGILISSEYQIAVFFDIKAAKKANKRRRVIIQDSPIIYF